MKLWKRYRQLIEANLAFDEVSDKPGLLYWRDQLFVDIIVFLLPVSMIALIPGIIMSIKDGIPGLAVYDTFSLIICLLIAFNRSLSLQIRKILLLVCFYLLSVVLLLFIGVNGPALIYLFAITIFSTLIFPVLVGYLTVAVNAFITIVFAFLIKHAGSDIPMSHFYDRGAWIAVSSNLTFLSILSVTSINLLFKGLHNIILKQEETHNHLLTSETSYKQMFNNNPLPMFIYDCVDYRFLLVNAEAVETYGYNEEEFYEMSIFDLRTRESADMLRAELTLAKVNGYRSFFTGQHLTKDGKLLDVEIQSDDISFASQPARIVTVVNVTERNIYTRRLAEQATLLDTIAKNFPNGTVAIIDANYTIEYMDGKELYKTNQVRPSLINSCYLDLFTIDKRPAVIAFLAPVFEGRPNSIEIEVAGEIYLNSAVLIDNGDNNKSIVIASQNVTEQRLKERSLTLFEAAIINSEDGFVVYNPPRNDTDPPIYAYVNAAFERLCGYSAKELIGTSPRILHSPGADVHELHKLDQAIQQKLEFKTDLLGQKKNGDPYWVSVHIIPVFDEQGNFINYISMHHDTTAKKRLEEERETLLKSLAHSEQNLKSLINNTTDLIWSLDRNLKFITFNEAFAIMGRHYHSDFGSRNDTFWKWFNIGMVKEWDEYYSKAFGGQKFSRDIDFILPMGKRYIANVSFNPIFNLVGEITGVGCFSKEITQRRIYEEKIQHQNEKLKEIAFLTSHSLRAPLTNIMGFVRILDTENFSNPQNKQSIEYIYKSAIQVDEVIHEIVGQTILLGSETVEGFKKLSKNKL